MRHFKKSWFRNHWVGLQASGGFCFLLTMLFCLLYSNPALASPIIGDNCLVATVVDTCSSIENSLTATVNLTQETSQSTQDVNINSFNPVDNLSDYPGLALCPQSESAEGADNNCQDELIQGIAIKNTPKESISGSNKLLSVGGLVSGTLHTVTNLVEDLAPAPNPMANQNSNLTASNPNIRNGLGSIVTGLVGGICDTVNGLLGGLGSGLTPLLRADNGILPVQDNIVPELVTEIKQACEQTATVIRSTPESTTHDHNKVANNEDTKEKVPFSETIVEFNYGFRGSNGTSNSMGSSNTSSNNGGGLFCVVDSLTNTPQLPLMGSISEKPDPLRLPPFLVLFSPPG